MNLYNSAQTRDYLRKAFDASPNALIVADHDGKVVLVNSSAEGLFDYKNEELTGRWLDSLFVSAADGGLTVVRKGGEALPVETSRRTFEADGAIWTLCTIANIAERHRAEALESEKRFRLMADSSPVMICCSGPDKRATFFNTAWLEFTGRTLEQQLGFGWVEGVHPADVENLMASYESSLDARRHCFVEFRLRRQDGEYRWIACSGMPHFGPDGAFGGYVASCSDTTEARRGRERALAHQKWEGIGLLANGVAHDFNNLLGGILTSVELAMSGRVEGAAIDEELRRIKAATVRGSETVRQLMIYAGKEGKEFEPVDLAALVREMQPLLQVSISKQVTLEIHVGQDLPPIEANPAQIRRLIMNLVVNGSEAITGPNGVVRVAVSGGANGSFAKLEISDTGGGMTPEIQDKMFDPFFSTKPGAQGLGLSVVQGIARNHGVAIMLTSETGRGTSFQISFPAAHRKRIHSELAGESLSVAPVARSTPVLTVLLVEDEDLLRQAVTKALNRKGVAVIEAPNGTVALELLNAHLNQINTVLLDMTLPGIPSRQVAEQALRLRPDLKVILTSAYPRETVEAAFAGLGIADFIRKPFHLADLVKLFGQT